MNDVSRDLQEVVRTYRGKRALVTGANGFVGGRLVVLLTEQWGISARVFVRRRLTGQARKLAREVQVVIGNLNDASALANAVAGCDVVFHCAYDPIDIAANHNALAVLIDACTTNNVRLVHVSSFAVYYPWSAGALTEADAVPAPMTPYATAKGRLDATIGAACRSAGLDAVIVLPTIVYGPYGKSWTVAPAERIISGTVLLPANGLGLCNAVHVDDVCQALLRCGAAKIATGERFLISATDVVTWKDFYSSLALALGESGPQCVSDEQRASVDFVTPLATTNRSLAGFTGKALRALRRAFGASSPLKVARTNRRRYGRTVHQPDAVEDVLYRSKCRVSIAKAVGLLNYAPRYDFASGMADTEQWLKRQLV